MKERKERKYRRRKEGYKNLRKNERSSHSNAVARPYHSSGG
jgi:hypothetical protein